LTAIRYKQELTKKTIDTLDGCYGGLVVRNDAIYGTTERMQHCIDDSNLYIGEDLHNKETGECFTGRGSLWSCGSRFCAFCVGKISKEHRAKMRYTMQNTKLLVGENWYLPTFTMPDAALKTLSLEKISAVMQTAWEKFAHYETNENKSQTWFQKHFRGGFKNCEFTYTRHELFHYHIHGLMIGSCKIQRNRFLEVRSAWTKSLKASFKKHNIEWQCDTGNKNFIPALRLFLYAKPSVALFLSVINELKFFGLAVVNVQKIERNNWDKTINEVAKYVTKGETWSKIPDEQLVEIASIGRFFRMFEGFGLCRRIARRMTEKPVTTKQTTVFNLLNLFSNLTQNTYLDTTFLIPSVLALLAEHLPNAPPKKKKRSWFRRLMDKEITLPDYCKELEDTVAAVVNFRKIQLRRLYPFATFKTVNGIAF
jgi:23S rRNA A1618 N6-methylase RlmF